MRNNLIIDNYYLNARLSNGFTELSAAYYCCASYGHNYSCSIKRSWDSGSAYFQGSKGIRQWPINWGTSPMWIHKITPSLDYNKWLKRLDTQLYAPTYQKIMKVPKVVKPTNKKTLA